jgi:hypothetical protein
MSLKKAVPFLRTIVKTSANSGASPQYTFHDGYCYGQNPSVLASYPTPHILGTFGLAAEGLEAALGRMSGEPAVEAGDEALILKYGRLRSTIKVFESVVPYYSADLDDDGWEPVPPGLTAAIKKASLFMSSRGTWQTSIQLTGDSVAAINDRSALVVSVDCPSIREPACLTDTFVRWLDSQDDPDRFQVVGESILFSWSDTGAWVKGQLSAYAWPNEVVSKVFESAGSDEPPIQLTADWREALEDMVALSDGHVEVSSRGLKGVSQNSVHEVPFETGVSEVSRWSVQVVKQLMEAGERWNPDASRVALFTGPSCRGVLARQK